MSVHGASHIKCVACDLQIPLQEARSQWWICITCGSYICTLCRALFLETDQGTCPGTIVRGVETHLPHLTRFLGPQRDEQEPDFNDRSKIILLGDVRRCPSGSPGGRAVILEDAESHNDDQDNTDGH